MKILRGGIYKDGLKEKVGRFVKTADGLNCHVNGEWRRFANEFEMRAHWPGYSCVVEEQR